MEEIKKYKGSIPMAGGLYPASGGEYPLINTALIEKDSVSGQRLDKYLEEYPYPFIYVGTAANKEMLDSLLPETEDSDNRSFIAFNKGEQVYYARSPITKEWTVCSASISEIANSVEGASLIGIGDDVNEFIDISSVKAYINTGEEDDEYQLIEKQDLMSDDTFSKEEKNKIKFALGVESGIRVSDTQPDGNNEMIDVWINTSEEEETVELVSKSDLQDSNYFTENQKGLVREAIGVVGIEDIAQELGDDPNKVLSRKLYTETIKNIQNGYVNLIPITETYIEANTGLHKFNSTYTASQKIPCNGAKNIEIYVGSATRMCAFYSEDDSFVATLVLDAGVNVINVPDGATKFAVSATNEVFPTFLIKNTFFIYDDVLDETSDNTVKNKVIAKEMKELNDKFIATEKAVENSYPLLNLIDKSKASLNTSVVSANGNVVANTNWDLSDYIYLKPNTTYYGFGFYFENFYAFYDINKNFITEHGAIIEYGTNKYKGTITTGETALYIRVSLSHSTRYTNAYISEYEDKYYAYGEYDYSYASIKHQEKIANIETSINRADKKVLVLGDSISTDIYGNYKKWVSHLIDEGFFSTENTTNDSIHATGFVARLSGGENDFITRIKAIENKADYDLVIVFGGVNDYIQNIPFGESGGDATQYFIPAVDYFFEYLVNNFTQARICVISPLRMFRNNANTAGKMQTEYADYIKHVTKSYSLPLLNATDESGFCPYIQAFKEKWTRFYVDSNYPDGIYDGLHPNEEYEREYLAPYIKSFIVRYI